MTDPKQELIDLLGGDEAARRLADEIVATARRLAADGAGDDQIVEGIKKTFAVRLPVGPRIAQIANRVAALAKP